MILPLFLLNFKIVWCYACLPGGWINCPSTSHKTDLSVVIIANSNIEHQGSESKFSNYAVFLDTP